MGKLELGLPSKNPGAGHLRLAKAYAEGYEHARTGGLIGDVTFPDPSPEKDAWERGFAAFN